MAPTLRAARGIGAAILLATITAPCAAADPPDYSAYRAIDPKPFQTYSTYGGGGVQFTSPTGLLCRIVVISRGMFAYAECFGKLPGAEGSNKVDISTTSGGSGIFTATTKADFLAEQTASGYLASEPTGESAFYPLPVGSSITYTSSVWSGTCAVDVDTTSCTVSTIPPEDDRTKSFVLGPTDSTIR
ncbi:Uncharacterised protein [Mycobacteroides abscessus subsp. abscessus]|uniref:hypothetical protein n=1 Tax=Mycobacteroides abscessus TaxID=36809 RepID=UPI00092CBB15|nr:hypothetical protein [Mycobacteroides abscessus]SHP81075.1 Uncharacterised protein [Mycobacteroides abscessus subsp. bolletii]SHS08006.1 Uncharacterised protein [Mycobacteroides abscessus subsp. bolletii]SHS95723.1 Uncharacterised protein [Mycobacteroides abscessus subsp. bolletii]SKF66692.1 Uncharacterised protein [Mycobacteroides abscessus subsp. bolletii]SKG21856.1 Uncharacterised protein [Mycobacteroides abscessus subsp. bolletii]